MSPEELKIWEIVSTPQLQMHFSLLFCPLLFAFEVVGFVSRSGFVTNNRLHFHAGATTDRVSLNGLTRQELQSAAKKAGIKGNIKSSAIIEALSGNLENKSSPAVVADTALPAQVCVGEVQQDLAEALLEQGLSWHDLLQMQSDFTNGKLSTKLPSSKRQLRENKAEDSDNNPRTVVAIPQHLGVTRRSQDVSALFNGIEEHRVSPAHDPKADRNSPSRVRVSTEGVTVESMLHFLVEHLGFSVLHEKTNLKCFGHNPSVASSLKVLRQEGMEWARRKLEHLYIEERRKQG